jgi:hypothetical protein
MTTERAPATGAALALMLAVLAVLTTAFACSGAGESRRPDGLDVRAYPPRIRVAYDSFAFHCSRCHSLARPLTAQVDDVEHWHRYVERMRRQPASGIDREDARVILEFLVYWTEHGRDAPLTYGSQR